MAARNSFGSRSTRTRAEPDTHGSMTRTHWCRQQDVLSLVVPSFALGPVGLDHTHLVEMQADGNWDERRPEEVFIHA